MFAARPEFERQQLDDACVFYVGALPAVLQYSPKQFDDHWSLHPQQYHEIRMPGGLVKTPRWQQAYGADYHYTGRTNKALPVPPLLEPLIRWPQEIIDGRLHGMLLNWYDGTLNHYIGKHRDSTKDMVQGAPIVTVSLGEEHIFRLRPWKGSGKRDIAASRGTVFVMPFDTNLHWTHEVPHVSERLARHEDARSRLRAFQRRFIVSLQTEPLPSRPASSPLRSWPRSPA